MAGLGVVSVSISMRQTWRSKARESRGRRSNLTATAFPNTLVSVLTGENIMIVFPGRLLLGALFVSAGTMKFGNIEDLG